MSEIEYPNEPDGVEDLRSLVNKVIEDNGYIPRISPSWIATQVMVEIQFGRSVHRLGYVGCHLELRQIARQKLGKRFDPIERITDDEQGELLPDTLQERYPCRRTKGEEPVYVRLNLLTQADVAFNVAKMRRASAALAEHADALEAWDTGRRGAA